ncbi:MAG TPA: arylesterase [Thermoanaerobaculia bacterium]|jgi:lysophospholipase L1-like esterase
MPRRAAVAALLALLLLACGGRVKNLDSHGSAIIAFGDSLTAGYGAGENDAFPSVLSQRVGQPVINACVSGDTTESAAARLDRDVLARDPRIVLVGLGGNDFLGGTAIATTEANLRDIVRRIQQSGAMVVILGFNFPSFAADYAGMYKRVAHDEHCLLIPDLLDGILSNPQLKSDEIHPNARGYAMMAERISGPLRKLLRRANAAR